MEPVRESAIGIEHDTLLLVVEDDPAMRVAFRDVLEVQAIAYLPRRMAKLRWIFWDRIDPP